MDTFKSYKKPKYTLGDVVLRPTKGIVQRCVVLQAEWNGRLEVVDISAYEDGTAPMVSQFSTHAEYVKAANDDRKNFSEVAEIAAKAFNNDRTPTAEQVAAAGSLLRRLHEDAQPPIKPAYFET